MTDPTAVAEVLERAADALFVYGRCAGQSSKHDGSMCVLGAIKYAQGLDTSQWVGSTYHDPAARALGEYLGERFPDHANWRPAGALSLVGIHGPFLAPWIWNDCHAGSEHDGEVIDTLRLCAKDLRNEEA